MRVHAHTLGAAADGGRPARRGGERGDLRIAACELATGAGLRHGDGMNELVFHVTQESDGGYVAEALGESIFTQADTWEELRHSVREAVSGFYFDGKAPDRIRLHLVRDEVIA